MDGPQVRPLTVRHPTGAVCVVTAAGDLDAAGVARLSAVVRAQLALAQAGHRRTEHVVVDLSGATSIAPGALRALLPLRDGCARAGIGLHLAGGRAKLAGLPLGAHWATAGLGGYPTAEVAVVDLARARPGG